MTAYHNQNGYKEKKKRKKKRETSNQAEPDKWKLKKTTLFQQFATRQFYKLFNPIAFRKAKIVYNFGLSECIRVKCQMF